MVLLQRKTPSSWTNFFLLWNFYAFGNQRNGNMLLAGFSANLSSLSLSLSSPSLSPLSLSFSFAEEILVEGNMWAEHPICLSGHDELRVVSFGNRPVQYLLNTKSKPKIKKRFYLQYVVIIYYDFGLTVSYLRHFGFS